MLAVLVLPTTSLAGKPKAPKPIPLDDRNVSKLGSALKDRCPEEYGGLTASQRGRAINTLKRFIQLTIGFYLEDDGNPCNAELAAALKNFCKKNKKVKIEIVFGQEAPIEVIPDGKKGATRGDTIRISGKVFKKMPRLREAATHTGSLLSTPLPQSFRPTVYWFITELMSEALRVKHETKLAGVAQPDALLFKNDVAVLRRKLDIYKDLKAKLQELLADPFTIPDAKYRINRRVLIELQGLSPDAKRLALTQKYLDYICNVRIVRAEKELAKRWADTKKKFGLAKGLGLDEIDETIDDLINNKTEPVSFELWTDPLKKTAFFTVPNQLIDEDFEPSYHGGGGTFDFGNGIETIGDTVITQVGPNAFDTAPLETELLAVTGVDHVYHMAIIDGGATMLVAAGEDSTGDGLIIAYSDTDFDGFFEAVTRTEAIRDSAIYGGAWFTTDSPSGNPLLFSRGGHCLYGLSASGPAAHNFPDTLDFRGSLGFQRFDLEFVDIDDDGLTASATGPNRDRPIGPSTLIPYAQTTLAGGEFIPVFVDDYFPFLDDEREPDVLRRPVEADLQILATGQPGNMISVQEVSGASIALGTATVGTSGEIAITLSRALLIGDVIRLIDLATTATSDDFDAIPLTSPPVINALRVLSYGKFLINFEGIPGSPVQLESATTLADWVITPLPDLDDVGTAWVEVDFPGPHPSAQFRISQP